MGNTLLFGCCGGTVGLTAVDPHETSMLYPDEGHIMLKEKAECKEILDPEQQELTMNACNFQPSINQIHQMIKPILSEIRDMTDEESSNNQDLCVLLDRSNQFEIAQGIKWHDLVILLMIIIMHIGLV